jgi:hypothetical protein
MTIRSRHRFFLKRPFSESKKTFKLLSYALCYISLPNQAVALVDRGTKDLVVIHQVSAAIGNAPERSRERHGRLLRYRSLALGPPLIHLIHRELGEHHYYKNHGERLKEFDYGRTFV